MVNQNQLERLLQSSHENNECRAWNKWREDNPGTEIDLDRAHLAYYNLQCANLEYVYLRGADMQGARLEKANLQGAHLIEVELPQANLQEAYLFRANLEGANLFMANLTQANLEEAYLRKITNLTTEQILPCKSIRNIKGLPIPFMRETKSMASNLMGWWNPSQEILESEGVWLEGVDLRNSRFENENFKGTNLSGAWIYGTDILNSKVRVSSAQDIKCTHLELGEKKGDKVLYFEDEEEVGELEEYLESRRKTIEDLYQKRVKEDNTKRLKSESSQSLSIIIRLPKEKKGTQKTVYFSTEKDRLGGGAYGTVYKSKDEKGNICALKLIRLPIDLENGRLGEIEETQLQKLFTQDKEARSALTEAVVGQKLGTHPNLAEIHCFGYVKMENGARLCLLSRYIEGEELGESLKKERSEKEIVEILLQICEGLKSIHSRGIVHRDLSSRNIMVEKNGTVKVIDFGISFFLDTMVSTFSLTLKDDRLTDPEKSRGRGNPIYMAPEVWEPHKYEGECGIKFDPIHKLYNPVYANDVWALGVITFELWSGGRFPFTAPNSDLGVLKHKICNEGVEWPKGLEVSEILQLLISSCLAKSPKIRPSLEKIIVLLNIAKKGKFVVEIQGERRIGMIAKFPWSATKQERTMQKEIEEWKEAIEIIKNRRGLPPSGAPGEE